MWFEGVDDLPLLVKFLFTSEKLSVQVHPNDDYARAHHNSRGKTEMWHVLAADPGAKIAAGFRGPLTPERLREAALSGEIEDLLQWFDAAPGDTFFIPAGTVHAIGAGLALCEIQQHSDITYRLYDYGRPRELHLDPAIEVSHLGPYAARQQPQGEVLVSCEYFRTERMRVEERFERAASTDCPEFLVVIEGHGEITDLPVNAGDVCYIPRQLSNLTIEGRLQLLRTFAFVSL